MRRMAYLVCKLGAAIGMEKLLNDLILQQFEEGPQL